MSKPKQPTLTLLMGLPYSGKTYFRRALDETVGGNAHLVSSDEELMLVVDREGISYEEALKQHYPTIKADLLRSYELALQDRLDVMVDRTNLTYVSRAEWIIPAKQAGYQIIGIMFSAGRDLILERMRSTNLDRRHSMPIETIEEMYNRSEPPEYFEGFDMLYSSEEAFSLLESFKAALSKVA